MKSFQVQFIGTPAFESLAEPAEIRTVGNTSRGLFLELFSGRIVFVSRELYRGPLTLNLSSASNELNLVKTGEKGNVTDRKLTFPTTGVSITWQEAAKWHPAPPPNQIVAGIKTIANVLQPLQDDLLDAILKLGKNEVHSTLEERILVVYGRGRTGDWETALDDSRTLLGLGVGLTPEGDDFLIGLSLALVRSGAGKPQQAFAQKIAKLGETHTTRLSANLLACAADGLADERLIDACDALAANAPEAVSAVQTLLGWGSTSGRMALAGIAAGLLLR